MTVPTNESKVLRGLRLAELTIAPEAPLPISSWYPTTIKINPTEDFYYDLYHVKSIGDLKVCATWIREQKWFLLDTETSGLDPLFTDKIATIQVGNPFIEKPTAFVIDYRLFTREQLTEVLDLIADPKRCKLGQNIKFEHRFLYKDAKIDIKNLWDTQIAEMIIRAGLFPQSKGGGGDDGDETRSLAYSHTSMDALYRRYFNLGLEKDFDLRTSFYKTKPGEYTLKQLVYAAGDVIYPAFIRREQEKEIEARALRSVIQVEMAVIRTTSLAELRGIMVDRKQWIRLYQVAEQKRQDDETKLHKLMQGVHQQEIFGNESFEKILYPKTQETLNFGSPQQLQWAIKTYCEKIGWHHHLITNKRELNNLRRQYGKEWLDYRFDNQRGKVKTRGQFIADNIEFVPEDLIPQDQYCNLVKTDKETLKLALVKGQLPVEMITLLLEYSKNSQLAEGFGKEFTNKNIKPDGRIHTEFHQAKQTTGRYSTTPNLQNIPKLPQYRKCFIPAPGYKFVIADYSQQEPRLSAQASQDPVYINTYLNDEDLYLNVLEVMLGYHPDRESSDPELASRSNHDREVMKVVVLAMAYRMGVAKLYRKLLLALAALILAGKIEAPTYEYVKSLHAKFLQTFTKLVDYQNYCSNSASHSVESPRLIWDRYINAPVTWATGVCGRKRFFAPDAEGIYTAAANSPIQGSAATMSKAAAVLIQNYIDNNNIDAGVVDMVHDELVYECKEEQAAEFAVVVKAMMEKAGKFYLPDVPIKAEFPKNTNGVVDYWTKEVAMELAA